MKAVNAHTEELPAEKILMSMLNFLCHVNYSYTNINRKAGYDFSDHFE